MRAQNSNGTSVGTFSKFNLLRGRCTLLLSLPLLTSLCAPGPHGKLYGMRLLVLAQQHLLEEMHIINMLTTYHKENSIAITTATSVQLLSYELLKHVYNIMRFL